LSKLERQKKTLPIAGSVFLISADSVANHPFVLVGTSIDFNNVVLADKQRHLDSVAMRFDGIFNPGFFQDVAGSIAFDCRSRKRTTARRWKILVPNWCDACSNTNR
jgi:hypothetical protein